MDKLSALDQKTFNDFNKPPYVQQPGNIPFLDVGGKYVLAGATYSPELLTGKSQKEIAAALSNPGTDIAKAVGGSANVLTAALCTLTDQQPAKVCSASGVKAAAAKQPTS